MIDLSILSCSWSAPALASLPPPARKRRGRACIAPAAIAAHAPRAVLARATAAV